MRQNHFRAFYLFLVHQFGQQPHRHRPDVVHRLRDRRELGHTIDAILVLSTLMTEISSGTFKPASKIVWIAPIAISSVAAKIAVGRSSNSRKYFMTSRPESYR